MGGSEEGSQGSVESGWDLISYRGEVEKEGGNLEGDDALSNQPVVEVPGAGTFDDILSNTSSDESDYPGKPESAGSAVGNSGDTANTGVFGTASESDQRTLILSLESAKSITPFLVIEGDEHADGEGEQDEKEHELLEYNKEFYDYGIDSMFANERCKFTTVLARNIKLSFKKLLTRIQNLETWQIILLTSSFTALGYYWIQQLWTLYQVNKYPASAVTSRARRGFFSPILRSYDYDSSNGNEKSLVFNDIKVLIPFKEYGTKKFIVDFDMKVAYPVTDPHKFIPTRAGKYIISRLLGYQIIFFYKLNYEWLPQFAYRYQVFANYVSVHYENIRHSIQEHILPGCQTLSANLCSVNQQLLSHSETCIKKSYSFCEDSFVTIRKFLSTCSMGRMLKDKLFMTSPEKSLTANGFTDGSTISKWVNHKCFLVTRQAQNYYNKVKECW